MTDFTFDNAPTDLFRVNGNPADAYRSLEQSGAEARFKRMDLIAGLYAEELPNGKQGVRERVLRRLELDAEAKSSKTVVQDAMTVFTTFRTTGEHGLGYTREQLTTIPYSRLRAVAQNRDWALSHRDEIEHVLTLPEEGENSIRSYIKESKAAEAAANGEEPPAEKPRFESRSLRLTAEMAGLFDQCVTAMERALVAEGNEFSSNKGVRMGELVFKMVMEFFQSERPELDEAGRPLLDAEGRLVTYNLMHLLNESADEEQAAETEAA